MSKPRSLHTAHARRQPNVLRREETGSPADAPRRRHRRSPRRSARPESSPDHSAPLLLLILPLPCPLAALFVVATLAPAAAPFPWQDAHARHLPHGDLEWTPSPYVYTPGEVVRYIDFAEGDDSRPGTSPAEAWKHHPWDTNATGRARSAAGSGIDTYVFKGGVVYRGRLDPRGEGGAPQRPIRLVADPTWGRGSPLIYGSEHVTGWRREAHPKMPQPETVWAADVPFHPRTLWLVDGDDIVRLRLARDPNWHESNPNDPLSEWPAWEQPEWWTDKNVIDVDGRPRHLGIDRSRLRGFAREDIEGATVWTEWGIVMGSPYPARVERYVPEQGGVAFRGPWTFDMSEKIITGNRYYLEDKPQWLDEDGEFWVERHGRGARIYVRLAGGRDPNEARLEAGRHTAWLKSDRLQHIEVAGLTFRFTNIHWEYDLPQWAHDHLRDAVIRLAGGGDGIVIRHNVFEHVVMPIRITASAEGHPYRGSPIGTVRIHDNVIRHTDHEAIVVAASSEGRTRRDGPLEHVAVLRNRLEHIGWRNLSGGHGHAIDIRYPATSIVAGNFLRRIAGWGIAVFGGKASGHTYEIPLSRHLIFSNRVEDVLLKSNDWGGIETWQGGSFYVFNNLVINPRGFKNWIHRQGHRNRIPAFGHAYYLDGSFKNYLFNNIAWGKNNQLGHPDANNTALQNIFSFENTFFHNTFFRFGEAVRQQEPSAGRVRYLGNIIEDASILVFRNADPRDVAPDPNAAHYRQGGRFSYSTIGYTGNVLAGVRGRFGVFEENGAVHPDLASMRAALERVRAQASDIGTLAPGPVLRAPTEGDFRPRPGSPARASATRVFVPWALARTVGEWPFRLDRADATRIGDEHWHMTIAYGRREDYRSTPRYPLRGAGLSPENFGSSPSENWVPAALTLDGRTHYLSLAHADLDPELPTVDVGEDPLLIEVVFRPDARDGSVVEKRTGHGYQLALREGRLHFVARDANGTTLTATSESALTLGAWHHVVAELDRTHGPALYLDGRRLALRLAGAVPTGSLANAGDFYVGGTPDGDRLAATFDFLRVALTTLAESRTTIEELHAWQTDGPHLRDFAGRARDWNTSFAGALEPE